MKVMTALKKWSQNTPQFSAVYLIISALSMLQKETQAKLYTKAVITVLYFSVHVIFILATVSMLQPRCFNKLLSFPSAVCTNLAELKNSMKKT